MTAQPNLIARPPSGPGVHVLVIGVSAYTYLKGGPQENENGRRSGLGQLNGPAKSASSFAAWMLQEHYHSVLNRSGLKSLRVLISPADGEQIDPGIDQLVKSSGGQCEANRANVEATITAFRNECQGHPEDMVVVYVCGHGVQQIGDGAKMLLSDYGSPNYGALLSASLNLNAFYNGMQADECPQTQFWFYDCCAQPPEEVQYFEELTGTGIGLDKLPGFAEVAPIYMSASPGTLALGRENEESFFCQAFLWALDKFGAADVEPELFPNKGPYLVTTKSLGANLKYILSDIARLQGQSTQYFRHTGCPNMGLFHEYRQAPKIPSLLRALPEPFQHVKRSLNRPGVGMVPVSHNQWPIEETLDAGLYVVSVTQPGVQGQQFCPTDIKPSSKVTDVNSPGICKADLRFGP